VLQLLVGAAQRLLAFVDVLEGAAILLREVRFLGRVEVTLSSHRDALRIRSGNDGEEEPEDDESDAEDDGEAHAWANVNEPCAPRFPHAFGGWEPDAR